MIRGDGCVAFDILCIKLSSTFAYCIHTMPWISLQQCFLAAFLTMLFYVVISLTLAEIETLAAFNMFSKREEVVSISSKACIDRTLVSHFIHMLEILLAYFYSFLYESWKPL